MTRTTRSTLALLGALVAFVGACADQGSTNPQFESADATFSKSSSRKPKPEPPPPPPPAPAGIAAAVFTPDPIVGGTSGTATVTLTGPAVAGGQSFYLTGAIYLIVPSGIIVPEGKQSVTFSFGTRRVSAPITNTFFVDNGVKSVRTSLTLVPDNVPMLHTLACLPTSSPTAGFSAISNGQTITCTVSLNLPAPAGGAQVILASTNQPFVPVPSSLTIPAGQLSVSFPVTGTLPSGDNWTEANLTASYDGTVRAYTVVVLE